MGVDCRAKEESSARANYSLSVVDSLLRVESRVTRVTEVGVYGLTVALSALPVGVSYTPVL